MSKNLIAILLMIVPLIAGCQAIPWLEPVPGNWFVIDSNIGVVEPKQQSFMLTVEVDGHSLGFPSELSLSDEEWALVCLSHIGGPLFIASIKQDKLTQQRAPVLPEIFSANVLLRDMQLAFASKESLLRQINQESVHLLDDGKGRTFLWRDTPYIRIEYSVYPTLFGEVRFENLIEGYSWSARTLKQTEQD